ncbi:hypothetical protein DSO57_1028746 [Entomophthora muscae]|uniref:Uncharacterized protein n=1 Tax=Entomophthora muscae TaxID=34485 RepID=A0ACC2RSA2_9FUNG|nr:hypothetical protein DSO57_1028746 [Entomophthora muscae]
MLLNNLASYSGPYKVACRDIEYIKQKPVGNPTSPDEPELKPTSLLVKIFYPAEICPETRSLARWCSYPSTNYFRGFFDYKNLSRYLSTPLSFIFGRQPRMGAYHGDGSELLKGKKPFPVAIFSHGLAGSRNGYSGICGELASHGFVVCAIEHRDGTAVYSHAATAPHVIEYQSPPGNTGDAEHREFYQKRIDFRVKEVVRAYELLKDLNTGKLGPCDLAPPLKDCPDFSEISNEKGWVENLKNFAGRLDLRQAFALGHSFGGATILDTLARKNNVFKAAVVFDPWMYPIEGREVRRPLLAVNTQGFTDWKINFDCVKKLLQKSTFMIHNEDKPPKNQPDNALVTLPDTTHVHQSDIPSIISWASSRLLKSTMDPALALRRTASVAISYLNRHIRSGDIPPLAAEVDIFNPESPEHKQFQYHDF